MSEETLTIRPHRAPGGNSVHAYPRSGPSGNPKAWLAGRAATVGLHALRERLRPPVARTARDIPVNGVDLTREWLTDVLCRDVADAEVVDFHSPGGHSGTSTRAGLRVTYNDAGREAGLPTELYTKTTANYSQRLLLGGADVLHGETHFFTSFRPEVEMEAPKGYFGGVDSKSWRSVILMEDIAATKGATFIEPTTPLSREQIEDLLRNLAAFHGVWWDRPELSILKTPEDHFRNVASFIDMGGRCKVGMERAKSVIPPGVYGQADRMWKGTERCLQMASHDLPLTLLHGDSHVGQTYITADGRMGLTDWQATMAGGWAYDVAYLVGSACEPEDRRAWDRELLELYLGELADAGGDAPSFDDAWLRYRQMLFYPYSAWAFTIGRAAYQPRMQPDEISLAILKRLSTAIDDLQSFDALGI